MIKISRNKLRLHRKRRIKAKLENGCQKPHLAVFKSLTGIYAQVIDDARGFTLVSASTKGAKFKNNAKGAKEIGKLLAKKCLEKKITAVAFDRSGYKYHGKIKALADGAREAGLKL